MRYGGIIYARPLADGRFVLRGDTFNKKDQIKEMGGEWDGNHWTVPERALKEVGARREFKMRMAAHCHTPEETIWGDELDVKRGTRLMGCSMCDKAYFCGDQVPILEVFDEP